MGETVQHEAGLELLSQYNAYRVPVASIFYDESFNCRGPFTLQSVEDLAASIAAGPNGLPDWPVVVQPWDKDGYAYRLLAGHRRFVAMTRILGYTSIPSGIRYGLTEHQARILNFTENLERKDLNPLEEAQALGRLFPEGVTLRAAAAELKRPTGWVADRQRLLRLPEQIQQWVAAGMLGMWNIKVLVKHPTPEKQIEAARKIVEVKEKYGKTASLKHLDPSYRPAFGRRKSKDEINAMATRIIGQGIVGLPLRVCSWCAGYISDKELEEDIQAATPS
jgi:ParB/RepB/Spo0J family partition protein